ncbi:ribbon-helix-helix protein, CopG family [Corynebacterium diphtheriae]|uniref:type II toxin-antitoxin system RelB family antitoxin n=1 Tax=Corynebacterium diphtheriae TaxID=1717 RepID=UPI00403DEC34
MSNPVISLRIGASEKERLDELSRRTGRSGSFYIREALEKHLDELEYVYGVRSEYEAIRRGERETISLDEVERDLLDD